MKPGRRRTRAQESIGIAGVIVGLVLLTGATAFLIGLGLGVGLAGAHYGGWLA